MPATPQPQPTSKTRGAGWRKTTRSRSAAANLHPLCHADAPLVSTPSRSGGGAAPAIVNSSSFPTVMRPVAAGSQADRGASTRWATIISAIVEREVGASSKSFVHLLSEQAPPG